MRVAVAAGVLALAGLAACAASPTPERVTAASLVGTRWIGVVEGNADARTLPRLEFVSKTRLIGYTGCNMMNGGWKEEGGEVKLGPLATTKRACAGTEGQVEQRVTAAFAGRVSREGLRLVFTAPGGERFEFAPAS